MRGRKAAPAEIQEAKGNPGRRPLRAASTEALPLIGDAAPRELNAAGKTIWNRLVPHLRDMRLVRQTDREVLARYCNHVARYWKLEREIRRDGATYLTETNHGSMKRINPAFAVQDRIEKRMEAIEDRLGLSTRSRHEILRALSMDAASAAASAAGQQPHRPAQAIDPDSPLGLLQRGGADDAQGLH